MLSKLNRNMKHLKDNSWHVFTILLKCKGLLIVNQRVTFYVESEGNRFHPNDADYSNQFLLQYFTSVNDKKAVLVCVMFLKQDQEDKVENLSMVNSFRHLLEHQANLPHVIESSDPISFKSPFKPTFFKNYLGVSKPEP